MNNEDELKVTAEVMKCKNCDYRVVKSEVDQNEDNCPNCNEIFQPLRKSSN